MRARRLLISRLALVAALALLLLSCASGQPSPSRPVSSPLLGPYAATLPAARSPSGSLVLADRQFPDAVNPLFASSAADFEVSAALWAAPVVYDDHFRVQPDQLTEVPLPGNGDVLDNGQTIIMRLRHDLRWSDGQPLLARDFVYWWQLDQDPDTGAITTSGYDQIASIATPDDYTVVLHMKHPFGPYLAYLPFAAPYHAWSHLRPIDLQNNPRVYLAPDVTSGPYKLASFANGQGYTFAPNPYYTSTTFHGPFLSRLTFSVYGSTTSMLTAIQSQQVDIIAGFTENDLSSLAHLPASFRLLATPAAAYEHLDFNMSNALFQDVRARQAIQRAIDICTMLRTVLHMSDCSRATAQVEPSPSLYNDPSLAPVAYDPNATRNLLAQAGWQPGPDGILSRRGQQFTVRLVTTANNPIRTAVAQFIQQDLRAVGIHVTIAYYSLADFFAVYTRGGILATGAYDLALFGYQNSPEPDDEYAVFHSSQIPTATQPDLGNYGRVSDPIIDSALTAGRDSIAFPQRQQAYHTFLDQLAKQVYLIPLYTDLNVLVVNRNAQNVLPNPDAITNNWNIADWWVNA